MSLSHDPSASSPDRLELLQHVRASRGDFVEFLTALCAVESPTSEWDSQRGVHAILTPALEELGFDVRVVPGRVSGDHILAVPRERSRSVRPQLLIGHTDTVWKMGTLESMPIREVDGRLHGPGTLDMKGGLTQMVFALRALRALGRWPSVPPIIFVNADEEVGSPDSRRHVRRLARLSSRAWVLEPALGEEGLFKTARKGVGNFEIVLHGVASHAGLDPLSGASAIVEAANVIRTISELNDHERGTTLNVGIVEGGTRANVIAAEARLLVDVRVVSADQGREVERTLRALEPVDPRVRIEVAGGMHIPPLERTPRNSALWNAARDEAARGGFSLADALAGGGSDGNTTSLHTATLDGLGCVGDGAHADHEHIEIEPTLDRCALLAQLLMLPQAYGR